MSGSRTFTFAFFREQRQRGLAVDEHRVSGGYPRSCVIDRGSITLTPRCDLYRALAAVTDQWAVLQRRIQRRTGAPCIIDKPAKRQGVSDRIMIVFPPLASADQRPVVTRTRNGLLPSRRDDAARECAKTALALLIDHFGVSDPNPFIVGETPDPPTVCS